MIDTIVFGLYIGDAKPEIRQNIINHWLKKESYNVVQSKGFIHRNLELNFTRKHLQFNIEHPSSHYNIHADLDDINNIIKFNFSIPKYNYGHNLMPAFYHYHFNDNPIYDQTINQKNLEITYSIFLNTIFDCCNMLTLDMLPLSFLLNNIQIYRIDICRNYLFSNKEDCLLYLENIKRKKIPYKTLNTPYTYESSLMYVFDNYSVKIYHKGFEVQKDKKHLSEIFSKSEFNEFMLLSDRTLRYECTIRLPKIKELFIKTFRRNCKHFLSLESELIDKFKIGSLKLMPERSVYYKKTSDEELQQMYKNSKPNKKFTPEQFYYPCFDYRTLIECIKFSYDKFELLQAKKLPSLNQLSKIVDDFNELATFYGNKKINRNSVMKVFKLLQKHSLDELVDEKVISRASKYNYIKIFNLLQIPFTSGSIAKTYIENIDTQGSIFMENVNVFADKCLQQTMESTNFYLKSIRD